MHRTAPALLLTTLFVVACSSPTPPPSVDDAVAACEHHFDALAKRDDTCFMEVAMSGAQRPPKGPDTRYAPETREGAVKICVARTKAPGSNYLPPRIEACASALARAGCFDPTPDVCAFLPGTFANGTACAFWDQCASGLCRKRSSTSGDVGPNDAGTATGSASYCGTCEATMGEGESCTTTGSPACRDGLRCLSGKCGVLDDRVRERGEECMFPVDNGAIPLPCPRGDFCSMSLRNGVLHGTCTKLPTLGEVCTDWCAKDLACAGGRCVAAAGPGGACPTKTECAWELACTASGTCEPYAVVPLGAACGTKAPGTTCAVGTACVLEPGSPGVQRCIAKVREGGACETTAGSPPCEHGRTCTEGRCTMVDPAACK